MFDLIASKLEEAQAFADGLVVNLDVINMDRLLEEQEREEKSKGESLRLLRDSGDTTDATSRESSVVGVAAAAAGTAERKANTRSGGRGALGEIEIPQLRTDVEQEYFQQRSRASSPQGAVSERSFGDRFASLEESGGNFEDEFDPILASIRRPPQPQRQEQGSEAMSKPIPPPRASGERKEDSPFPALEYVDAAARPTAGSTFAAGFLSILPGDMRAKAGAVMAQSSARISESANALRSALDPGGASATASATDRFKRRQSDPAGGDGALELEEGRGDNGGWGGRRAAVGAVDEGEVRLMNVNELLSEEERQQLASFSGGSGGAGRFCGWRRLRKYIPIGVGIGLLGLFYLWRWTTLLVGDSANEMASLGSTRT